MQRSLSLFLSLSLYPFHSLQMNGPHRRRERCIRAAHSPPSSNLPPLRPSGPHPPGRPTAALFCVTKSPLPFHRPAILRDIDEGPRKWGRCRIECGRGGLESGPGARPGDAVVAIFSTVCLPQVGLWTEKFHRIRVRILLSPPPHLTNPPPPSTRCLLNEFN